MNQIHQIWKNIRFPLTRNLYLLVLQYIMSSVCDHCITNTSLKKYQFYCQSWETTPLTLVDVELGSSQRSTICSWSNFVQDSTCHCTTVFCYIFISNWSDSLFSCSTFTSVTQKHLNLKSMKLSYRWKYNKNTSY